MKFEYSQLLKDGRTVLIRQGTEADGEAILENYLKIHSETDYLVTYADENDLTVEDMAYNLKKKEDSSRNLLILAFVDGQLAGSAGFEEVGSAFKVCHRAEFGITLLKEYWGLGIGRLLTQICIDCARAAGYRQLELDTSADNSRAISLYKSVGFKEYGRNPLGLYSRFTGDQGLVLMRLEL